MTETATTVTATGGGDAAAVAAAAAKTETVKTEAVKTETASTDSSAVNDAAAAAAAAGTPYRPEGLPDHLLGKDDKETTDKLLKAYKGAREEMAKKGNTAPETADGYTLQLADDLKDKVIKVDPTTGKDPIFEALKPALHKAGLSNDNASMLVTELYKSVAAQIQKNAEAEQNNPLAADIGFKQLGGADKAKPLQDSANAWINGVADKVGLSKDSVQELQYLTHHSQGLKLLNELRGLTSEKPIPADFGQANPNRLITQADIDEMYDDPRYAANDPVWDGEIKKKISLKQQQEKATRA